MQQYLGTFNLFASFSISKIKKMSIFKINFSIFRNVAAARFYCGAKIPKNAVDHLISAQNQIENGSVYDKKPFKLNLESGKNYSNYFFDCLKIWFFIKHFHGQVGAFAVNRRLNHCVMDFTRILTSKSSKDQLDSKWKKLV